jgi:hypothetical protein
LQLYFEVIPLAVPLTDALKIDFKAWAIFLHLAVAHFTFGWFPKNGFYL